MSLGRVWMVVKQQGGSRRNWLEYRAEGDTKATPLRLKEAREVRASLGQDWEILHFIGEYPPDQWAHLHPAEQ